MEEVKYSFGGKTLNRAFGIEGHFVVPDDVEEIGKGAFECCSSMISIEIPNSVTKIGNNAFSYCISLTNIEIPNSVKEIGENTFLGCSSLNSINIPNSVRKIGENAFRGCNSLNSIEIPNSVTEIGEGAFEGCSQLKEPIIVNGMFVKLPENYEGKYSIPLGVQIICKRAFKDCSSLTSIEMPNSVTEIGECAFEGCSQLKEPIIVNGMFVKLPENYKGEYSIPLGIKVICDSAFACCSITAIEIPNSVIKIGSCAFESCRLLNIIEIPNSVTEISMGAFAECSSLTNVEIPNSVTKIGEDAFYGCSSLTTIEIPNLVTEIGEGPFYGCPIKCFSVDKDHPKYTSEDGVLFDKAKEIIIRFPAGKEMDSYHIPVGVVLLKSWAFEGTINLQELFLPDTIKVVGSFVFEDCQKLTKLHLRVEDPNLISIDDNAFKDFALDQCTLYVPIGTGYAYRHHPVFGKFKEVIIER